MGRRGEKKSIEDVLAGNFSRWKDLKKPAKLGVAPKTANNVENARHNTKLSTVAALAQSLGIEPYQLLLPVDDEKFLAVVQAWEQSDARGRDDLQAIAEAILKRRESGAGEAPTSSAAIHRRRDGVG